MSAKKFDQANIEYEVIMLERRFSVKRLPGEILIFFSGPF